MRALSWNIGGAHLFNGHIDGTTNYGNEDIKYFINAIQSVDADAVGLQESHMSSNKKNESFSNVVSRETEYVCSRDYPYGNSHIKEGNHFSLVTLAKNNLMQSSFQKLPNPNLSIKRPNGDTWITFDVGFLHSKTVLDGQEVIILNCHLIPFHYFKKDVMETEFDSLREYIQKYILKFSDMPTVVLGDFNHPDLTVMLPDLFQRGQYQYAFLNEETTPGKGQQDHILYSKHWQMNKYEIRKLRADHYQCIADLTLKK